MVVEVMVEVMMEEEALSGAREFLPRMGVHGMCLCSGRAL